MARQTASISNRLTLLNLLASVTALIFASVAFFAYDLNAARRFLADNLNTQAKMIGYDCISPLVSNDPQSAAKALSKLQTSPRVIYAGVYAPSGRFFAGYWRAPVKQKNPVPLISAARVTNRSLVGREFAVAQPIVSNGETIGTIYIRSDARELASRFESYLMILGAILIVSLAAALIVSRIAQRAISKPLAQLAETARAVSRDRNYSLRAPPSPHADEIALVTDSFNEMLAEIQQRDATLHEREEQFRTLVDSLPQLACMAHANGEVFWFNERWYEYTGKTPEEMLGWGWQSVHDPNVLPDVLARWREAIQAGQRFDMVFPIRGSDGNYREFLTLVVPVRDADGNVVRWLGTNTDITEQRRAEEALRESEKLAATGRLAASIAHEINNPLEAVANLLYLAKKHRSDATKYITSAEEELDRIAEITKHTLGFYRDSSTAVKIDVAEVTNGVLALYDRKLRSKKITVKKRLAGSAEIVGFSGEVRQMVANLVANAIDALTVGGCLSVKVLSAREWGTARRSGVRVTVMDNGSGIDRDQMQKIFEPFYTTKKDIGTGLGLWLTQNLVRKHHGTISVRSTSDDRRSGTAFSIFLPLEALPEDRIADPVGDGANDAASVAGA